MAKYPTSFFGFDNLFQQLDSLVDSRTPTFPPANIVQFDSRYEITLALAGYKQDDLRIEHDRSRGILTISGDNQPQYDSSKPVTEEGKFLMRQIAARKFSQTFTLADNIVVDSATMENGLLTIVLKVEKTPESEPLLIPIA